MNLSRERVNIDIRATFYIMKINEGNRRRVTDPRESIRRGRAMNGHRNVLQIEFHFRTPLLLLPSLINHSGPLQWLFRV